MSYTRRIAQPQPPQNLMISLSSFQSISSDSGMMMDKWKTKRTFSCRGILAPIAKYILLGNRIILSKFFVGLSLSQPHMLWWMRRLNYGWWTDWVSENHSLSSNTFGWERYAYKMISQMFHNDQEEEKRFLNSVCELKWPNVSVSHAFIRLKLSSSKLLPRNHFVYNQTSVFCWIRILQTLNQKRKKFQRRVYPFTRNKRILVFIRSMRLVYYIHYTCILSIQSSFILIIIMISVKH